MTENVNPKLFNISHQKCQHYKLREQRYWVYQSVNRSVYFQTEQNSTQKLYKKCRRFVYRLG